MKKIFFLMYFSIVLLNFQKNNGKEKEWIENRKIDIELKIDGKVCDPQKFFEMCYNQYNEQVKKEATNIVKKQTSEKFIEICNKINNLEQIVESYSNEITGVLNLVEKLNLRAPQLLSF